ncbi:tRNA uridine-5-carboxymethylaminomethyl(34) synthesis GTPase MnmE [Limnovirga soli]|uniref:tRNA modification GTPase MnmE n=1 Tax=Limnovirga soli TaxID=2656915 RepID=A0A8J8JUV3_9BACT|nr:tRNA uridine-5-carboxymethylaminomethyl(34) synthesis GTPase MnmE [Limnovirga soli]NNV56690.1 tRNA uridine-5-carboxymethylaminomethyl(34) synthesis GTPase MnmE [Limnovirga soli]
MRGKFSGWDDTIAALATPQGVGAIGVIRVSGAGSFTMVNALFPSKNLMEQASHTLHVGLLKQGAVVLDEVVLALFKGPRSYTGEDVIEISCHGSNYIQEQILQALVQQGARIAKPGEFTQRAFLNGKLDLAQAEAVADLIASNTEASKKTSIQQMRGGFSHALKDIRDQLLSFSALIELELDFSQEDVEFADRTQFFALLKEAQQKVGALLSSFALGNVIKNGVQVAIIGKPNAGKSTLLNTLLNEERAIVSDIAGTTRDTIEETLNINGILFRLVDTAGIREHTNDIIEGFGVERSLEKMRSADIVLYLFDVQTNTDADLQEITAMLQQEQIRYILVGNKADGDAGMYASKYTSAENIIYISARNKQNIATLTQALYSTTVQDATIGEQTIITNARHVAALEKIQDAITEIMQGMEQGLSGDLLSLDIKTCLHYLGEITGEITNEDQLDYIFSKFCIGK